MGDTPTPTCPPTPGVPFIDRLLPAPRGGGFAMQGYWVWCGSVIRGEDGLYHMFASRWPQSLPFFAAYPYHSEVVHAVAETPEGPYAFEQIALPARGRRWWDGMMTHNPTIHKSGDTYLLYYIGSTHEPGGKASAYCIGLATSRSVWGPWRRGDRPILAPRPGEWDSTVATNPAPCVLPDGRVWLVYRSNTPDGLRLGAAVAERFDAEYRRVGNGPVIQFPQGHWVEDPYIWHAGERFQMLAKDWTGFTGEAGAGLHAWSADGKRWQWMPHPKAYSRTVRWDDGTAGEQGHLERPQLLIQDGRPTHLFLATGDGESGFEAMRESRMSGTWNLVIPLRTES